MKLRTRSALPQSLAASTASGKQLKLASFSPDFATFPAPSALPAAEAAGAPPLDASSTSELLVGS